ncbi:porin [Glaciecola sp. 1036]|uniref:porin n=1 Tax=Alteromonadaceae TaxID=72275 RepID=UPI003CFD5C8B
MSNPTAIIGRMLLAAFIMLLIGKPAFSEEGSIGELYSKINVNAQLSDEGGDQFTEIRSNNSWIGVKGDVEVDDDLTVVYRLEWKVDITGESGSDNISARPQYVGLRSKTLGELTIGRNFTPVWAPGRALDLFNHYEGDIKVLWEGENRLTDVVTYITPTFNNFRIETLYQADKSEGGDSAVSSALFYGDRKLKKTSLYAGIAHDFDVEDYDVTRIFARFKLAGAQIGAMYQTQEPAVGGESENGVLLNASYKVKNIDYKIQYQTLEDDSNFNIGLDYILSKSLKLYTWYSLIDKEDVEDKSYFALGIQYNWSFKF